MTSFLKSCFIRVLSWCAKHHIGHKPVLVIGVTGSMGKTGCRMIVSHIVKQFVPSKVLYTSPKNFNGEIGLPLSILQIESYYPTILQTVKILVHAIYKAFFLKPTYDMIVLEYGIDHPGEMQHMLDIVIPDIAIWTGLDYVHVSNFDDIAHIASEKAKLVLSAKKLACICIDHPLSHSYISQIAVDCITFSNCDTESDLHVKLLDITYTDTGFVSHTQVDIAQHQYSLQSNLLLSHDLVYAGLACVIADTVSYRYTGSNYQGLISTHITNQGGRFNILKGIGQSILIDSTYNATPQSMYTILAQTNHLAHQHFGNYRLVMVLGQMNELGDQTIIAHQNLAPQIVGHAQDVILYGTSIQHHLGDELMGRGYPQDHMFMPQSRADIIQTLHKIIDTSPQPCLILFKGSQGGNYLEECIKPFLSNPQDSTQLVRQDSRWLSKKSLVSA